MAIDINLLPDRPELRWVRQTLDVVLASVRHRQGRPIGRMEALGPVRRRKAVPTTLTQEAVRSNEIDGDTLNREQVRSFLAPNAKASQ